MSDGDRDDFLSRWSRRKIAARSGAPQEASPPAVVVPAAAPGSPPVEAEPPAPLPPVESLTPESDFTPFMRSEVDPLLRQQALRTLFRDPRFNVMDGLDVYISDFSQPDPIPPEWLGKLNQMARLGDYHPPEEEETPAEPAAEIAEGTEIPEKEQQVVEANPAPPSDTSAPESPSPELKQS